MRGTQFAQLTAFVAVAEHRSFTKAAVQLGIKGPSLSQSIRGLEETFGVRLLNRTTRSVALTEAGEQLLRHLGPVLEGVDKAIDAVNEFRNDPAGTIRLSVHPIVAAVVIGPLVARFSAEHPAIHLEISVDVERRDIVSERFDAGIHAEDGIAQDMIAVPIDGNFRLGTVASPAYLARHAPPLVPEDLRHHHCIRYRGDTDEAPRPWTFEKARQQLEVPVEASLSVNDLSLALRAALDGAGIVQLPEDWIAPMVAEGRLVQLLADWSPRWAGFCLFYPSRRYVPVKLRTLIDFLRKETKVFFHAERRRIVRSGATVPAGAFVDRLIGAPRFHAVVPFERDAASTA